MSREEGHCYKASVYAPPLRQAGAVRLYTKNIFVPQDLRYEFTWMQSKPAHVTKQLGAFGFDVPLLKRL